MLLADIKLQDDIRDDGSLLARSMRRFLRSAIVKARDYLRRMNVNQFMLINRNHDLHLEFEEFQKVVELHNYVIPTANAFGTLFEMMPEPGPRSSSTHSLFSIGFHLGAAILAVDCFFDWERDLQTGSYNPVRNRVEATDAAQVALHHLSLVVAECESCLGDDSRSARLARIVFSDLVKRIKQVAECEELPFSVIDEEAQDPDGRIMRENNGVCLRVVEKVGSWSMTDCHCRRLHWISVLKVARATSAKDYALRIFTTGTVQGRDPAGFPGREPRPHLAAARAALRSESPSTACSAESCIRKAVAERGSTPAPSAARSQQRRTKPW
jgi:Family of unknown function (DUF5685)